MTEITTTRHDHKIRINVVQVGKDKTFVEVPEGSTGDALLRLIGGTGKRITARGVEVQDDTPLEDGMTACVGPKSVKQGL